MMMLIGAIEYSRFGIQLFISRNIIDVNGFLESIPVATTNDFNCGFNLWNTISSSSVSLSLKEKKTLSIFGNLFVNWKLCPLLTSNSFNSMFDPKLHIKALPIFNFCRIIEIYTVRINRV